MRTIKITVPGLASKLLSGNPGYHHFGTRTKAKTDFQQLVYFYGRDCLQRWSMDNGDQAWGDPIEHAVVNYTIYVDTLKKKMDDDNFISNWKHGIDILQVKTRGKIQGLGIIRTDRGLKIGTITWVKEPDSEAEDRTVLEIVEVLV